MKIRIILFVLLLVFCNQHVAAQQGGNVFWTSPQGLFKASLNELQPDPIAIVNVRDVNDIAIDTLNQKLYRADGTLGKITRSNLDGTDPEILFDEGERTFFGLMEPTAIALDITNEKLYWAAEFGVIKRSSLEGTDIEVLIESNKLQVNDIAIDPIQGTLYWVGVEEQEDGPFFAPIFRRANLDGSNVEDVEIVSSDGVEQLAILYIALDLVNDFMYLTNGPGIYRTNLDGTNLEQLLSNIGSAESFAVDTQQNVAYWTIDNFGRGQLKRGDLDGGSIETAVAIEAGDLSGVAVDPQSGVLYWANSFTSEVYQSNLDGTQARPLITNASRFPGDVVWNPLTREIYWSDTVNLLKYSLDSSVVDTVVSRPTGSDSSAISFMYSIALDVNKGKVYWNSLNSDRATFVIQRSNLDGSQLENVVTVEDGLEAANLLDFDPSQGILYWSEFPDFSSIFRAGIDGSLIESVRPSAFATGIAVDSVAQKLYWSQEDVIFKGIVRANLDGTNEERLIDFSDEYRPSGIALDLEAEKMYWTDNRQNLIRRANLDGTEIEDVMRVFQPHGIAIGREETNTHIDNGESLPELSLENYPNPFTNSLSMQYTLHHNQQVRITVYDLLGRKVEVLLDEWQLAGRHQFEWNSEYLPGGMYLVQIEAKRQQIYVKSVIKL